MGQAAGVMDEMLSWPIKRAEPASASDESGSLAGCHLPSLETQLGTSSSKVLSISRLLINSSGLASGHCHSHPHNKHAVSGGINRTFFPASPRCVFCFTQLSSIDLGSCSIHHLQWLLTAVRAPFSQNPRGRTMCDLLGCLWASLPWDASATAVTVTTPFADAEC